MQNNTGQFICNICTYATNRRSSYEKHIYSWKHLKNMEIEKAKTALLQNTTFTCSTCLRVFKKRMWFVKHIRKCDIQSSSINTNKSINMETIHDSCSNDDDDNHSSGDLENICDTSKNNVSESKSIHIGEDVVTKELLMTMMKYVHESEKKHGEHMEMMQKQLEEERNQCKVLMSTVKDMLPRMGNFNNNQININIFLQERCKDALNMKDFVESLRIELNDVSKYQDRSMIDAVGNVFVNGLRQLDLYKRPIHCMDLTRETLYIKDNDAWENDTVDHDILSGAITAIAAKQSKVLQEWERLHPDWNKSDSLTAEYLRLVRATTCPIERGSVDENKIIHTIAKEVVVDLRKI